MRNKAELRRSQSGQILMYTTIIIMLAALILVPLMNFTFSSHRSAQIREQRTLELYASDAGIEDALYQIQTEQKGTALANLGFGNTSIYNPGTPAMNDRTENVTVQKVWLPEDLPGNATKNWSTPAPVNDDTPNSPYDTDKSDKLVVVGMLKTVQVTAAADDFDHGWPNGVSQVNGVNQGNWTGNWTPTGSASLASGGASGSCLGFTGAAGSANRPTNIPKYLKPELKFDAKASSFGASDSGNCSISTDGGNWTTVATWVDGNESTNFNSFDVDLYHQYGLGGGDTPTPLWVRFDANLSSSVIASHNFEPPPPGNSTSGGTNWASNWVNVSGGSTLTSGTTIRSGNDGNGLPIQGNWYLRLIGSSSSSNRGYAQRKLNLSGYSTPHLQFWAKAYSFEGSDNAQLLTRVGNSGSFTTRATWLDNVTGNYTDDNVYHFFDLDLSQFGGGNQSSFWIAFKSNMDATSDYFYVDDVKIVQSASFKADNVWIGYQSNSVDIEIAYVDPHFAGGNGTTNDPAYLDRIGIWMPPGCEYIGVIGNQTTPALNKVPDILPATYADGTILEWDFSPTVNLALAPGGGQAVPIVWDLTFSYSVPPTQVVQGMFTWLEAHEGPSKVKTYLSWDHGYEIYKAVSKAHSQILGTNTQVAAYAGQGEINKTNAASYGDYAATGAALLIDYHADSYGVRERAIDPTKDPVIYPSDPSRWTWDTGHTYYYDGSSEITTIPSNAHITAAWLYWSAFVRTSEWSGPDENASFLYPMRYGPESFAVSAGNLAHTVNSYAQSAQEPMDLLAHQPVLTLSNMRYIGEFLGNATLGNSTSDSWLTLHPQMVSSPAPIVKVWSVPMSQSGNYTINYDTGNVTIINPNLSGEVTIDYSVSSTVTLGNGTDYTINQVAEGNGYKYTGFTITNTLASQITQGKLQGTVTIDYYYAKHWVAVQHAAYDKYGTSLSPVQARVPPQPDPQVGNSYACFADVTQLLTGNGAYTGVTGDGQYAVGNVTFTTGLEGSSYDTWNQKCWAGWSLIVLYESPTEQAHQFYLYDPIHLPGYDSVTNPDACPFQVALNWNKVFNLTDFYPPEGTVSGNATYFVGEGDPGIDGDSIAFKKVSKVVWTDSDILQGNASDPNDPNNIYNSDKYNVMNSQSTTGEKGIDIDTWKITGNVGTDTEANVKLETSGDRWYLVYMILSFKTDVRPPLNYSFNVSSITYQYQLGSH